MDTLGAESCRPFIEAANAEHPSLIDINHVMAERFGVINNFFQFLKKIFANHWATFTV